MGDRIVSFVMIFWLAMMVIGLASLLLPILLFVVGFFVTLVLLRFIGLLLAGLFRC